MSLGKRLKMIREENGLTQEQLAKKIGLSQRTVSSYECDRNVPDMNTYKKLCDIYDCTIGYLTGTKEHDANDITIEDIMHKLATLTIEELDRIQEHIEVLIVSKKEYAKALAEKEAAMTKLKHYEDIIKTMETNGIRRDKL